MNATGYKIVGYAVWRGGKWYLRRTLRRRLPSTRTSVAAGVAVLAVAAALVALARRG